MRSRFSKVPLSYIERHPTTQSIMLGGRYINLSAISRDLEIDQSYLSKIFSGKRDPTIAHLRKLTAALRVTIDELLEAIEERKSDLARVENTADALGLSGLV